MPKSLKKQLKELDMLIRGWVGVIKVYPENQSYKDSLAECNKKRQLLAATIGRREYVKRTLSKR